MLQKLFDDKNTRPHHGIALESYRKSVLSKAKKRLSPKAYELIAEKFAKPQQWKSTVEHKVKSAIQAEDEMVVEGIANATDPDRGREVITASAWNLTNYEANPIILFNHNYNMPIGFAVEVKIEDNGLYYRASIGNPGAYPKLTDCQEMCRSLLAQGILRASSVGFLPLNMEYDEENDILRYTDVELLEISLVSVPMQQGSLLDSVGPAAKAINNKDEKGVSEMDKEQFEKLYKMCEEHKGLTQKMYDKMLGEVKEELEEAEEEKKSLQKKLDKAEAELKSAKEELVKVKEEKEAIEKDASALLESLEKNGISVG